MLRRFWNEVWQAWESLLGYWESILLGDTIKLSVHVFREEIVKVLQELLEDVAEERCAYSCQLRRLKSMDCLASAADSGSVDSHFCNVLGKGSSFFPGPENPKQIQQRT